MNYGQPQMDIHRQVDDIRQNGLSFHVSGHTIINQYQINAKYRSEAYNIDFVCIPTIMSAQPIRILCYCCYGLTAKYVNF